jgi:Ca2+-binding RTX toxin-like protein
MGSSIVGAMVGLLVVFSGSAQTAGAFADPLTAGASLSASDFCFGQQATIVGTRGQPLLGTEGPDVVVTNGALLVSALSGDDLVCVTGEATEADIGETGCLQLDAGEGDDRIDASGGEVPCSLMITPGPGRDEVLATRRPAGPGVAPLGVFVYAHDRIGSDEVKADADVIRTGEGPDFVEAGVQDEVHLAGGDDVLYASNQGASFGGVWDGGSDQNTLKLTLWPPFDHQRRIHRWRLDNQAGELMRDGDMVAAFHGFAHFRWHVQGSLRFIGSELSETAGPETDTLGPEIPLGAKLRLWPIVLEMGGGNDSVLYLRGGSRSRFDGGTGTDRFGFAAGLNPNYRQAEPTEGFLDLVTGELRFSRFGRADIETSAVGFEDVRWWSDADARINGTDGPNKLVAQRREPNRRVTIRGRGGNDTLRGGWGDDVLIGGSGVDVTDGREGKDRCSGEIRARCES